MRPAERHALEAIARALETTDPQLARELTAAPAHDSEASRRDMRDLRARGLMLIALWLLGLAFGATLLGLGLTHHVELTTVVGAVTSAAVVTLAIATACHHRHRRRA